MHDIAVSRAGELFVVDRVNRRIQIFSANGEFRRVSSIDVPPPAHVESFISPTEDGAEPTDNQSFEPGSSWAICISPDHTLWVADAGPGRILSLDPIRSGHRLPWS